MRENRILTGTVVEKFGGLAGKRYPDTSVRLEVIRNEQGRPAATAHANTDEDGHFSFDLTNEELWQPGNYAVTAFHPDARQDLSVSVTLDQDKGIEPRSVTLDIIPNQEISQGIGFVFLLFLMVCLGAVIYIYYDWHKAWPAQRLMPAAPFAALLDLGKKQLDALAEDIEKTGGVKPIETSGKALNAISPPGVPVMDAAPNPTKELQSPPPTTPESTLIGAQVALEDTLNAIGALIAKAPGPATHDFKPDEVSALKLVLERLKKAVADADLAFARLAFAALKDTAYRTGRGYFWSQNPWRLLEILFWSLAATLGRLILNAGYYLRLQCFHKHAIGHHLSLIVTIPILAMLIAFVVSLIDIGIKLGDVAISLDMSNVRISIIVAALIGLAPWKAREFLGALADKLFTKLADVLKPARQG